jgi:hypothetical protein
LEEVVNIENCSLVSYDRIKEKIEWSFEGCENDKIGENMGGISGNGLILEITTEDDEFEN